MSQQQNAPVAPEQQFTITTPPEGMATPTPQDTGGPTPTPQDDDDGAGAQGLGATTGEGKEGGQGDGQGKDTKAPVTPPKGDDKAAAKQPTTKPWYEERIKDQAIELRQAKRAQEKMQQELDQFRAQQQAPAAQQQAPAVPPAQQPQAPAQQPSEEQVEARAAQIAQQRAFDAECTAVANSGKAEFNDFEPQMMEYQKIGGLPIPVLEAALELGDSHRVLYNLSKNLDEALRISKLSPSRMGAALAKLAVAPPVAQPSNAPEPVGRGAGPRGGKTGSGVSTNPDEMTTAQWMEWREKTQRKGRR